MSRLVVCLQSAYRIDTSDRRRVEGRKPTARPLPPRRQAKTVVAHSYASPSLTNSAYGLTAKLSTSTRPIGRHLPPIYIFLSIFPGGNLRNHTTNRKGQVISQWHAVNITTNHAHETANQPQRETFTSRYRSELLLDSFSELRLAVGYLRAVAVDLFIERRKRDFSRERKNIVTI